MTVAGAAHAQENAGARAKAHGAGLGAFAVGMTVRHALIDDPIVGGALRIEVPVLREGLLSVQAGVERLRGRSERTGALCTELSEPGTCEPEPLRDDARLTLATGGVMVRAVGGTRAGVSLTANLAIGKVGVTSRGLTTGRELDASKTAWGGIVGIEMFFLPNPNIPLSLRAGAAVGGLTPLTTVQDGYTPFEGSIGLGRAHAGVVWQPWSR